jgi:tryptophan synthase alpha chain
MKSIKKSGADGVLIVDLPPEEAEETQRAVNEAGIELVYLLAPTSTKERIDIISKLSNSFIYLVSVTGVTGARKNLNVNLKKFIEKVKRKTKKPVCVGFGISEPGHVEVLKKQSNGIIIGSAIIKIIEDNLLNKPIINKKIASFVKKIKKSTIY